MAYSSRRYAKFSVSERVWDKQHNCEAVVEQTHLDLTNDVWQYRLHGVLGFDGWVNQDDLEKLSVE